MRGTTASRRLLSGFLSRALFLVLADILRHPTWSLKNTKRRWLFVLMISSCLSPSGFNTSQRPSCPPLLVDLVLSAVCVHNRKGVSVLVGAAAAFPHWIALKGCLPMSVLDPEVDYLGMERMHAGHDESKRSLATSISRRSWSLNVLQSHRRRDTSFSDFEMLAISCSVGLGLTSLITPLAQCLWRGSYTVILTPQRTVKRIANCEHISSIEPGMRLLL